MIRAAGSRGLRSRSAPSGPAPAVVPASPPATAPPVASRAGRAAPPAAAWILPAAGVAAGALIGNLVLFGMLGERVRNGSVSPVDVGLGILVVVLLVARRRLGARSPAPYRAATAATRSGAEAAAPEPSAASDLDRGVQDIRGTDANFDPSRFAGYTGMTFRDVHTAWMTRDMASLRPRLTAELYGALEAQCERLRGAGRSNCVGAVDVHAEITEAWQESGRDFVTAFIAGSMIDYTVDDASDAVVDGSRTLPRAVHEFWTFTRPAGLNFWMLSAIQTA